MDANRMLAGRDRARWRAPTCRSMRRVSDGCGTLLRLHTQSSIGFRPPPLLLCVCVLVDSETVYGLGANALNEAAVRDIFRFKGRPLSDPLIVHVGTAAEAADLVVLNSVVSCRSAPCPMHRLSATRRTITHRRCRRRRHHRLWGPPTPYAF